MKLNKVHFLLLSFLALTHMSFSSFRHQCYAQKGPGWVAEGERPHLYHADKNTKAISRKEDVHQEKGRSWQQPYDTCREWYVKNLLEHKGYDRFWIERNKQFEMGGIFGNEGWPKVFYNKSKKETHDFFFTPKTEYKIK